MNKNDVVWDATQGDTFTVTVQIAEDGVDANLTGKTLALYLNINGAVTKKASNVGGSGVVITSPTTGLAVITLTSSETAVFPPGNHEFAVKLEYSSIVQTLAKGAIVLKKNVLV